MPAPYRDGKSSEAPILRKTIKRSGALGYPDLDTYPTTRKIPLELAPRIRPEVTSLGVSSQARTDGH